MTEEPKQQQYSEAELKRIEQEVLKEHAGSADPQDVQGLTFDLTDEEIILVERTILAIQEKWFGRDFDLRNQMNFRIEVEGKFNDLGFVAQVLWEQAQHPSVPNRLIMMPKVTIVDRVGGMHVLTDHEHKRWQALKTPDIEDISPFVETTKRLMD